MHSQVSSRANCELPRSRGFYIVAVALVIIAFAIIYLPAVFRLFDGDRLCKDGRRSHDEKKGDDDDFKFVFQNVIILLLLAAVFALFVLYHQKLEMGMKMKHMAKKMMM